MPFLIALLLTRPAPAMNADKARRRADTALVCRQILAREHFELDDAITHGLAEPAAPGVYRIVGSEIDPPEIRALERLVEIKGGRALAIATLGSQVGLPVIDAIYYAADGARKLLSIKTSVEGRTNGVNFVASQLFRTRNVARRLFTREGLADHYHLNDPELMARLEFNRALMETILHLWELQREPQPRVTFLLDLSPARRLTPTLHRAGEIFPDSLSRRAREEDRVLVISHGGTTTEGTPPVFNVDSYRRDLLTDQQFAGAIILFRSHFCEMTAATLDLHPL